MGLAAEPSTWVVHLPNLLCQTANSPDSSLVLFGELDD